MTNPGGIADALHQHPGGPGDGEQVPARDEVRVEHHLVVGRLVLRHGFLLESG